MLSLLHHPHASSLTTNNIATLHVFHCGPHCCGALRRVWCWSARHILKTAAVVSMIYLRWKPLQYTSQCIHRIVLPLQSQKRVLVYWSSSPSHYSESAEGHVAKIEQDSEERELHVCETPFNGVLRSSKAALAIYSITIIVVLSVEGWAMLKYSWNMN